MSLTLLVQSLGPSPRAFSRILGGSPPPPRLRTSTVCSPSNEAGEGVRTWSFSGSACFSPSLGGFSVKVSNVIDHVDAFPFAYSAANRKCMHVHLSARHFVFQVCDFLRNGDRLAASNTRHSSVAL